eukprot:2187866-Rhodomonas_salina.3
MTLAPSVYRLAVPVHELPAPVHEMRGLLTLRLCPRSSNSGCRTLAPPRASATSAASSQSTPLF